MAADKHYAVLMGDLVGSSRAEPKALHASFNGCIEDANRVYAGAIASPLTITLGDEFQGLATSLGKAFELDHFIRIRLLGEHVESRVLLGDVVIETGVNPAKAWNMMGAGLAEARRKLGDKKDANRYRFSFPDNEELELLLDAVGRSLTETEAGWTDTQLKYVTRILAAGDESRSRTAKALGISQNSLYKVLRSAGYRFYSEQLETVRRVLRLEDDRLEEGRT